MTWDFGPYRVEELIARGGMGEVLRAYDTRHDRLVALKVLATGLAQDREYQERFRREAHAVARLREPHVIPIHAYGEIDGRLYLDMRLVDGRDVTALLDERGPMSAAVAVNVVGQVAQALDAAHAEGLIHRDVKPSNIIVSDGGFAYLVDFGIAHSVHASTGLTGTGAAVGTLAYMAPERFEAGPVDHRVDVYSLACVLYQCLTGARPFRGDTAATLINAHLNHEPPKVSAVRRDVPPAFDDVIARGMAKRPEDRFASAGELAVAARQALTAPFTRPLAADDVPTVVTSAPPPEVAPPPQPRRDRWWIAAVALGVVALALAGLLVYLNLDRGEPNAAPVASSTSAPTTTPSPSVPDSSPATSPTTTPTSSPTGATWNPRQTRSNTADLGVSKPISQPSCDGRFVVVLKSAINPAAYRAEVQQYLDARADANYLHAPSTGCASLRQKVNGADVYVVYSGPHATSSAACADRNAVGGDAYVKSLDNSSPPERIVAC